MTENLRINWEQIVTNSLSMLVASVFVGAAFIVWNAATTMDQKIDQANDGIEETQAKTNGIVDIMIGELATIQAKLDSNSLELVRLREAVQKSINVDSESESTRVELQDWAEAAPREEALTERRQRSLDRLTEEFAPYKQRAINLPTTSDEG